MGWWQSGTEQDMIGDGVVDRTLRALQELAQMAAGSGRANPTFEEILRLAGAAMEDRPEVLVSDPENVPPLPRGVALMQDGKWIEAATTLPPAGDVLVFWKAFDDIATEYLVSELERRPRLSELMACLAFVLRVEGQSFLTGGEEELAIERIFLVDGKTG